jgi:hypothetical protein
MEADLLDNVGEIRPGESEVLRRQQDSYKQ